jgi:hypothetical protein
MRSCSLSGYSIGGDWQRMPGTKKKLAFFVNVEATSHRQSARSLVPMLVIVALAVGIALSVYFGFRPGKLARGVALSPATRKALQDLRQPVQATFYSILSTNSGPTLPLFSKRVRALLDAYRDASNGKFTVRSVDAPANSTSEDPAFEGLRGFDLQGGNPSFLGMVLKSGDRKEVLPLLSPDYESALEADITRALTRLEEAGPAPAPASAAQASAPGPDPAIVETVKAAVPNYASISFDEGARTLRQNMLEEIQKAGEEGQAKILEAQSNLARLQQSGTPAEQEEARKAVTQAERDRTARFQEIIAKSQAELQALQQLKNK